MRGSSASAMSCVRLRPGCRLRGAKPSTRKRFSWEDAMSLSIKSHLQGRIVALFVGFFGGAIAFQMWGSRLHAGDFTLFVMPLFVFGGAFLLPFLFSRIVSAECPKCGSDRAIAGS